MARDDDDDDDGPSSRVCVDCSVHSPATSTSYTLISAEHGWRLMRVGAKLEWRCPQCWHRFKQLQAEGPKSANKLKTSSLEISSSTGATKSGGEPTSVSKIETDDGRPPSGTRRTMNIVDLLTTDAPARRPARRG